MQGIVCGPTGLNNYSSDAWLFSVLYSVAQATFLVWCYYPKTQGAKVIYSSVIKPYVVPALGLEETAKKED